MSYTPASSPPSVLAEPRQAPVAEMKPSPEVNQFDAAAPEFLPQDAFGQTTWPLFPTPPRDLWPQNDMQYRMDRMENLLFQLQTTMTGILCHVADGTSKNAETRESILKIRRGLDRFFTRFAAQLEDEPCELALDDEDDFP